MTAKIFGFFKNKRKRTHACVRLVFEKTEICSPILARKALVLLNYSCCIETHMLITSQDQLENFIAKASQEPFITVDTEFLREKTYYPKLCLIQLGLPDKTAIAVDPLDDDMDMTPVYALLEDENIIKVFHAARQDLEIFYNLTGKIPAPLFDTQVAAMVCGYGDQVSYDSLVRQITGIGLDKTVQFTDWSRRPLTPKQINYALGDVTHLVDAYQALLQALEEQGRASWVKEEMNILQDPQTYAPDPSTAWERIKIKSHKPQVLAVLQALASWRELRARKKNIPKNWVMRDETLADMAAQMPASVDHLKKIRNMSADLAASKHGHALLKTIAEAKSSNPDLWPKREKKKPQPPKVLATIEILKLLQKICAAKADIAPRLIAGNDDLQIIATKKDPACPAMQGWRHDIFGQYALALKDGKIALGLKGEEIAIIDVK